ncbi:MAG: uroporphyrinogen decarboxylase family protein [Phycisphaerae bacterium]
MADALQQLHGKLAITRTQQVGREQYVEHMTFDRNHSPMLTELFGPLVGLPEEWRRQGATEGELDFSAFRYRQPIYGWLPCWCGPIDLPATEILREDEEEILARDGLGRTMRVCKATASLPLPLDFPVRTRDDWERLKPHFGFSPRRFADGWAETARHLAGQGQVVTLSIPGGYDMPRQLMGDAEVCMAYYDQPELMRNMLATFTETACGVIERVTDEVTVDRIFVHEDMAGKSGPLAGPSQVREFIAPYYRQVWQAAKAGGVKLFEQDSDGDMNAVIEPFVEAGVNVMYPNEPAAGMDLVEIRERFGDRLALLGGIDKHVLRKGKAAIDAELEYKIPPMLATGGCVLGLDHRIPNGTPLEAYRYYLDKAWEIFARECPDVAAG